MQRLSKDGHAHSVTADTMKRLRYPQIAILLGAGVAACSDYRADPKLSAPVWATLEPSLKRCGRSPLKVSPAGGD
ncbi:hypothetical protein QJQ45_028320 [Haematococcus lacustris]|nr:hypothetical protein QJQ45_028320 [Haematococcus lacustris]